MKSKFIIGVLLSLLISGTSLALETERTCNVLPQFSMQDSVTTYKITNDGKEISSQLDFDLAIKIACLMHKNNECFFTDECFSQD